MYSIYKFYDSNFIINLLEKTLNVLNNGGIKIPNTQIIRTISGTFIYFVKKNENISNEILKKIFFKPNKKNIIKKLNKKFNKLSI